jgi:hypothetical protein
MSDTTTPTNTETSAEQVATPPVLSLDGQNYAFDDLSDRLRMLSIDYIRTDQEWQQLQRQLRQFLATESTLVNLLKLEVEQSEMEPIWTSGEPGESEKPLLTIDSKSYDATNIPDAVRMHVEDLVGNNQQRGELEFRMRQLDAARLGYLTIIREELNNSEIAPLDNETANNNN